MPSFAAFSTPAFSTPKAARISGSAKRLAVVALNLYRNLSVVFRVPPAVYVRLDAAAGRYFRDQDSAECGRFGYLFSRVYQFNNCGYVADYRIPNTFVLVGAVRTVC